jgi:glycosyltransferase involved in cell wall biosynthesis
LETVIVIPAYTTDGRLLKLVEELSVRGRRRVLVVDDGSGAGSAAVFTALEGAAAVVLCRHSHNIGKGGALKTGFLEALRIWPECAGIVTADADGQHSAADIAKICAVLERRQDSLILGTRDFNAPHVPARSRWGNKFTTVVFRLVTGCFCPDTQTGLRGLPRALLPVFMKIPGQRYEYEMNMLLLAAKNKTPLVEVKIDTLYQDSNASSHFQVWRDSFRIYLVLVKFGVSSAISALLDLTAFTLLTALSGNVTSASILTATILARVLSGSVNYLMNRRWVFSSKGEVFSQIVKYVLLFCLLMLTSWKLVDIIYGISGWNITVIKILVDSFLFCLSFITQRKFIFSSRL